MTASVWRVWLVGLAGQIAREVFAPWAGDHTFFMVATALGVLATGLAGFLLRHRSETVPHEVLLAGSAAAWGAWGPTTGAWGLILWPWAALGTKAAAPIRSLLFITLATWSGALFFGASDAAAHTMVRLSDVALMTFISLVEASCAAAVVVHAVQVHRHTEADTLGLGSYALVERIGQGGMGEVWRAQHRLLSREAAVKLIRPERFETDPSEAADLLVRFEREAEATSQLRSPYTVGLYDFGVTEDGQFYYAMELLRGLDVGAIVRRYGVMSPGRLVFVLEQVRRSLAEAHGLGFIHRDLKPENIFVGRYGIDDDFVKVLDFGFVKNVRAPDASMTVAGSLVGTAAFMAPEVATGMSVEPRSDIYALGCVGYWALTGRPLFEASTPMALVELHATAPREPVSKRTDGPVPASLDALLLRCVARDPEQRPESVTVLKEQLAVIQSEVPWSSAHATDWWQTHAAHV